MTNDEHIAAAVAAYDKRSARIDEIESKYQPPEHCCASCASQEYRDITAKQGRAAVALVAKLKRRAAPGDADLMKRICSDYPQETKAVFPGVSQ